MARIRARRHGPVLRPSSARSRHDQGEPAKDYRRRDGLALLERTQARAEGVRTEEGRFSMLMMQSRRQFLATLSLAGAAMALPFRRAAAIEPPPETTSVRLAKIPVICFAPQYVCEALLRAEGFTDVRYIDSTVPTFDKDLASGKFDFQSNLTPDQAIAIDRGLPITIVTGVHAG